LVERLYGPSDAALQLNVLQLLPRVLPEQLCMAMQSVLLDGYLAAAVLLLLHSWQQPQQALEARS
jgi:hypothetical protein